MAVILSDTMSRRLSRPRRDLDLFLDLDRQATGFGSRTPT